MTAASVTNPPQTDVRVRKVSESLGALVEGVGLSGDLPEPTVAAIRAALLEHRVLFFRGQQLDDESHRAFTGRLGQLTRSHPTVGGLDDHGALTLDARDSKANAWHTDITFLDRVPAISVLRPLVLPPYGGTTTWANAVEAYKRLNPGLQAMADRLWAVHTNQHDYAQFRGQVADPPTDARSRAYQDTFNSSRFETEHPVVHVHPETGERSLLLGAFASHLLGVSRVDSDALIALLQRHVSRLENTVRWDWSPGDVAIWDNRATQHYGVADYGDADRVLRRMTVAGEVPVSVDGRRSVPRVGSSAAFVNAA
ncbi:taurine catabolism dioxygenase [Enemella dayhoffiae]|uniref:Taurine catabolism dioxygenase n=1 Tax=Enemella dayhoffiae TaxID=2016507 RepID=A0A255H5B8_9ACTN|nr:TauD/TfdA family dioxygenase [Enemella dayhoffiae]OYO22799.1 taurine catabolism dioxygenase [Enemella dayhoffiae]